MPRHRYEFRQAATLTAGALGKPGSRTFYLLVSDGKQMVRVWVEKEYLQALSLAITQLVAALPERSTDPDAVRLAEATVVEPSGEAGDELRAGKMALAYDRATDRIGVLVYVADNEKDDEPDLSAWASREQAGRFAARIDEVIAAGRPICPLCGGPIDPTGHVCPKRNGHLTMTA
ncbi:MAG: DUF3090 family protein [Chloroflexi bacterium]|nr:DUF3090 family protein [Chloroflexota bacterium]